MKKNGVTAYNSKPLLTVKEVAQMLHVHDNTIRRWSNEGIIKVYRISRRGDRRFKREDVDDFLARFREY
ncbi:MAG: DNA-binding protein [Chloroflexi bacterium RBG_16_56_11]|nr:MAG: DNA-binding protein [Chloroflexi bacterium RBG_16_56_11]